MADQDQLDGLQIALQFAQQQRNEQAERCINFATSLELANRKIATLEARIAELEKPAEPPAEPPAQP